MGLLLTDWPDERLLITAVRLDTGGRVVFQPAADAALPDAIAASCAIPGLFHPVSVDGRWHVDGGVHSPTNADLLIGQDVDLAIVVSPMSGPVSATLRRPDAVLRVFARRCLTREVRSLRAAGVDTVVIEPDLSTMRTMGMNSLQRSRTPDIVRAAFLGTTEGWSSSERQHLQRGLHVPRLMEHNPISARSSHDEVVA
jgi:NTE family protein